MIVGRSAERARLATVLDAARRGEGAAILVQGEPGAGKSVLLADAARSATDMRVMRVRGVESESPLPFAALHRLLRPLLRELPTLPPRQASALGHALGLSDEPDSGATDRFLVYLAVLTLLSDTATTVPTLVVVDDLHWVDAASREALLFVARRTEGERLALLLAAREDHLAEPVDLPTLAVTGLDPAGTRTLLGSLAGVEVSPDVADRLHAGTGGNALALAELAVSLGADVLAGVTPVPSLLPLTKGVEAGFLDRYHRLDPGARTVLLVAATDDSGDLGLVRDAARRLGAAAESFDAVERSGLLRRDGTRVELRHPLVRSAIYAGATTSERRQAHAALAAQLPPQDADRRAWHLAAAADHPDETVVAELEASARRSVAVGGHEAASAAWERAAELTLEPADRGRRLYEAAAEAWTAGRPDRAASLADGALLSLDEPLQRADAALLRARIEWNTGSVGLAHRRLLDEAATVAPHDAARARGMAMFAASLQAMVPIEPYTDPLSLVGEPTTARERCVGEVLKAFVHISQHQWREAAEAVAAAETDVDDAEVALDGPLPNLALAAMHLAVDDVALRLHERLLDVAREQGSLIMILYALTRRGGVDAVLGRWDELAAGAREALDLAQATGRPALAAMPRAWLALSSALRGDADAPDRLADLERTVAEGPLGSTAASVRDQVLWTRAVLADSPATAVHHYQRMAHGFAERLVALDRVETAVAAGRQDLAHQWLEQLAAYAHGTGSPWAGAVVEHGRALLGEPAEGVEAHFARALTLHAQSARRVDAARTHLAYGEWLRRRRRRVDARPHLRAALQTFEDVGSRRWAERAAEELRASGERVSRGRPEEGSAPRLTPTELRVATLVAQGLPTREVAATLFVSPRTVDFHLRNVFTKLGITSRAELAHVPLG
ncbi:helix-turn-helix transcriptional regulator [Ornithinicoccus halotolerans]|uniref:helix-turn-helix transcriptional regulator n=1 Tax=Ornithinicoccus halotolerans TaxID=1748220 RepID=UPI001886404E|nr:helix-turn-helix transcriptional regulator [Ornithinicoccus halotolerans]